MTSHISRIEIDIDWFGGLRDRIRRLRRLDIETMRSWITPALLVAILALLALQAFRGPTPAPSPPAPSPGPPAPKPMPAPQPIPQPEPESDPAPIPAPRPDAPARPKDTPLSRAMRDYYRQYPVVVPDTLDAMADKLDNGELIDKASSITFFKRPAAAVNAALDQVFSAGIDKDGKVTDPGKISGPLRAGAEALRRAK